MEPTKLVVTGSDPLAAAGIAHYLHQESQLQVVAAGPVGSPLDVGALAVADVHVLAVDAINAPAATHLRQVAEASDLRTVLVTGTIRADDLLSVVECRVVAILLRQHLTATRLAQVVWAARAGRAVMPHDLLGSLLAQVERLQRETLRPLGLTLSGLAARERDVLRLIAEGMEISEIARELSYSERTVKSILSGLLQRFGLNNRSQAVACAVRAGLI
jgi:DNA-binding NarL/FixJ family response regulator